jgi:uncharacterized membrane protein YfcA
MEVVLGFFIAVAIGVTGVGGGVITAPALMLLLGMKPVEAVTTSLLFASIIKFMISPAYLWRRLVDFRLLMKLYAGGIPGVVLGTYFLQKLSAHEKNGAMYGILGGTVAIMSCIHLYRLTRGLEAVRGHSEGAKWLPFIAFPIGMEVGFSSAGAGALGTLALMSLTTLTTAQVVATDVFFGLGLSVVGGGLHIFGAHQAIPPVLWKLLAGGVVGGWAGTYVASSVPTKPLRAALCLWLIVIGVQLCWKAL